MWCEQQLCGEDDSYHQDRNGWLAWYRSNEKNLKEEYLRLVQNGEDVGGVR